MTTAGNAVPAENPGKPKKKRKWPWIVGALLAIGLVGSCLDTSDTASDTTAGSDETTTQAEESTSVETTTEEATEDTTTEETPTTTDAPPPADDGIDWNMAPQDWATEYIRETCNPGESIAYQGRIICDVEGVDVSGDDDSVLEFYFSDDEAVEKHFEDMPQRREMAAGAFAEIVSFQRSDGEKRLDKIKQVRIIGPGGWTGNWDAVADTF